MIFEFFKRLFWKADEGNRKRKASDSLIYIEDNTLHPKKRCCDFVSSNHVKIVSAYNENHRNQSNQTNYEPKSRPPLNLENDFHNLKMLKTSKLCSPTLESNLKDKKCISKQDFGLKNYESSGSTVHETYRLNERKRYSEMLLNFIPSEKVRIGKVPNDYINHEHGVTRLKKYINNMESSGVSSNVTEVDQKNFFNPWCFLNETSFSNMHNTSGSKCEILKERNYVKSNNYRIPIEIIKTNTLRDKFSNKDVLKHDFIVQITKKYNQRIEQCNKEAEELKRMTVTLSKYNRIKREAALEDYLNRSMKLCEAVLDENNVSSELKLPQLDEVMINRIKSALSIGFPDEILVQEFGLRITKKDIQTLAGLNWLNDEVVNFYMNLLIVRGGNKGFPSVYAMNTFFYPKLVSSGHSSLKRWTRKIDIFAKDLIVIPIHLEIHWCMSIIDFRKKSICYYDSMGSPNYKCLQVLQQYLYDESMDKKKKSFDFVNWNFECVKNIPQQMNGSDCGVFSCMFAEYICANRSLDFSQEDMPYFRNKMIYEILTAKLL